MAGAPSGAPVRVRLGRAQAKVLKSLARFKVVVAGRRFGKTFLAIVQLLAWGLGWPGLTFLYIFPTYRQAKLVAWRDLKNMARPWALVVNETELTIELVNGALIGLRGVDKPDSLRGVGPKGIIFDEYQDTDPAAWTDVMRPAISDKQGFAMFVGTPKGWNHLKDLVDDAEADTTGLWEAFRFTTLDGGRVGAEEIEMARRSMDERTFRQEFLASFESIEGRVYYAFGREPWPTGNVAHDLRDPGGPMRVGMDFNVDPMTAVLWSKVADQMQVWGEVVIRNSNTEEMAKELRRRAGPGRQVLIYPDPSGRARKTSAAVGETDFTILRRAGFSVHAPREAPPVVDRINDVNAMLRNEKGERRLLIGPECKQLIRALDGLTFKPDTRLPDKEGGLDHITDALGYAVSMEFPIDQGRRGVEVSGIRVR